MKVKGIIVLLFFSLSLVGCETNSSRSKTYTITWNNDDGTTLEVDENVAYGSMPSYDGAILTKDDNELGYYALSGWSPSISKVKGNKTYVAQYSFYAYDDFLIYTSNGDETYNVKLKADTSPIILRIPSTHLDKPVTSIPNQAFEKCSSLTSVVIPDSVTSLGMSAFYYCNSLTSIKMSNNVTSIAMSAFYHCSSLASFNISDSVTSIGLCAFSFCSSLISFVIPKNVSFIDDSAFSYCTSLNSIEVDADNPTYSSFDGILYDKTKSTIKCFPCGKDDTEFIIPDSVVTIDDNAFFYCTKLISVTISDQVISLEPYAFAYCTSLTSIIIGNSVTSIDYGVFASCSSLTSLVFPDSVISIDSYAFISCSSLVSIIIPKNITSIGSSAFYICSSLVAFDVDEDNPNYSSVNGVLYNKDKTTLICYPLGKTDNQFFVPSSVTSIESNAFSFCLSLTSVIIPISVITIGNFAFSSCYNLTIYAEAESKPEGWDAYWNLTDCPVVWGYIWSPSI